MNKKDRSPKAKKTGAEWLRDAAVAALIVIAALGIIYLSNTLRGGLIEVVAETITTTTTLGGGGGTTTTTTSPSTTTTVPPTTTTVVYEDGVQGSCLLLEERWCGKGILVEWTKDSHTAEGGIATITIPVLAFELPPGTPIFAPADGEALYVATQQVNPSSLGFEGREVGFVAFFVRNLESPEIGNFWEPVEEGEILGLVSEFLATGGKGELNSSEDYNLIVDPSYGSEVKELPSLDDFEAQRDFNRWFWEGWFGMEAQPFIIIEP